MMGSNIFALARRSRAGRGQSLLTPLWIAWRLPVGATVLLVIAVVLLWNWAIAANNWQPWFVPPPSTVGDILLHHPDQYSVDLQTTIKEVVAGFLLGNLGGFGLALLFLVSRRTSLIVYPLAVGFQAIPVVVFVPIFTLILGHGLAAIVLVATLICFFPTLLSVSRGLKTISPNAADLFQLTAASRWEYVRHLAIPWSLPYLFNGLRTGAPASVLGAVVAEWVAGTHGIGIGMANEVQAENPGLLWTFGVLSIILVLVLTAIVAIVERAALWWYGN
jgi:NitT/TauT family transport system permease protein